MRRYLRLLAIFWRSAVTTELEYRVNFLSNALLSVFWVVWAAVGVSVYFRFTGDLRGWTYPELLVVVGLFFTVNGIRQALLAPNLSRMTEYVRLGTLDFLLSKPVDAQFLVSFRYVGVYNFFDPLLGLGLAGVGLAASGRGLTLPAALSFLVLLAAAVVLLYGVTLLLMSAAVKAVSSEGIDDLVQGLVETSRFPVQLYGARVQALLTVVVPIAVLTTYPAQALLGRGSATALVAAPLAALAVLAVASAAWRAALRSYTGASS